MHKFEQATLDDMAFFVRLIRHSHLSGLAREMGVSSAYVSKRLGQLEAQLGGPLLLRSRVGFALTPLGSTWLEGAQQVLDAAQNLQDALAQQQQTPSGLLRVCSSTGFGRNWVGPALGELAQRYPLLDIELTLLDRRVDLVAEGFDLDVRVGQVHEPNWVVRCLRPNQRVLCASPAYLAKFPRPIELGDLQRHQCILIHERDQLPGRWLLQGPEGEHTVKVRGTLSTNNGEVATQWALAGQGIVLRSEWDVQTHLQQGRLVHVLPQVHQDAPVMAVYPTRLAHSARLRVCVEFLQAKLGSGLRPL